MSTQVSSILHIHFPSGSTSAFQAREPPLLSPLIPAPHYSPTPPPGQLPHGAHPRSAVTAQDAQPRAPARTFAGNQSNPLPEAGSAPAARPARSAEAAPSAARAAAGFTRTAKRREPRRGPQRCSTGAETRTPEPHQTAPAALPRASRPYRVGE